MGARLGVWGDVVLFLVVVVIVAVIAACPWLAGGVVLAPVFSVLLPPRDPLRTLGEQQEACAGGWRAKRDTRRAACVAFVGADADLAPSTAVSHRLDAHRRLSRGGRAVAVVCGVRLK
jgi:hypothetical protein